MKKRNELDKKVALRNFEVIGKAKEKVTTKAKKLEESRKAPET